MLPSRWTNNLKMVESSWTIQGFGRVGLFKVSKSLQTIQGWPSQTIQSRPSPYRVFKAGWVKLFKVVPALIDPFLNSKHYVIFNSTSLITGLVRPNLDDEKTLHFKTLTSNFSPCWPRILLKSKHTLKSSSWLRGNQQG